MNRLFYLLILLITGFSACESDSSIVKKEAIEPVLLTNGNQPLLKIDEEIDFWSTRFKTTPDDIIARSKIASLFTRRFSYSGNIADVHHADSLYQLVNQLNKFHTSATYRSLAANCITMHQFRKAASYIDSALAMGDDKLLSVLMNFDVSMELGNFRQAVQSLESIPDKGSFEYLIRASKYEDHVKGNLDKAINLMEMAQTKAIEVPDRSIHLWVKSNLADMYGHANRFEQSYRSYLEVLHEDPSYFHALKGLAWLAFSKDRNYELAEQILQHLKSLHPIPDYDLILAEIAAAKNDQFKSAQYLNDFNKKTANYMYGNMYNKYRFILQAEDNSGTQDALKLAETEVLERPTPEVLSWLAWAYLINGQKEKALETVKYYVRDKSFEPMSIYVMGKVYAANGMNKEARSLFESAKESSFELGPGTTKEIDQYLSNIQ